MYKYIPYTLCQHCIYAIVRTIYLTMVCVITTVNVLCLFLFLTRVVFNFHSYRTTLRIRVTYII